MARKRTARRQQNPVQRFVRETMGEMRKVTWPSRKEATNLTIIVLVVVAFMTMLLGSLDFLFGWLLGLILGA